MIPDLAVKWSSRPELRLEFDDSRVLGPVGPQVCATLSPGASFVDDAQMHGLHWVTFPFWPRWAIMKPEDSQHQLSRDVPWRLV